MDEWVVSIEWLAAHLDEVRTVDVRDEWEFDGIGHIPGAVNIPFERFRGGGGDIGHLPGRDRWESLLGGVGLRRDDPIVAYDDTHGVFAARFLVTALRYGHDRIALLDGDFSAWQREHPVDRTPSSASSTTYDATTPVADFLLDAAEVMEALDDPTTVVVDTRDQDEYGAGHLPNAVNLDWLELVDRDRRGLLPAESLEARLTDKGIVPGRRIVLYCNTARRLSHTFVVLKHLGFPDVRIYEGSLTDWLGQERPLEGTNAEKLDVEDVS